jgi:signal transduction histidine kinase
LLWFRYRHRRQIERLKMLQATERERARIARDMHDVIGSRLSRLSMLGAMAVDELADTATARPRVQEMTRGVREAASELEHIIWAMNPKNDTLNGLAYRICQDAEEYFAETSVQCRFGTLPEIPALAMRPEARSAVSSAVKEALANVLKHASATAVELSMQMDAHLFQVRIVDNGIGFDTSPRVAAKACGNGLSNMRERLAGMGGEFRIESAPGRGTTVILRWPLESPEQAGG